MINKAFLEISGNKVVRVTFTLPNGPWSEQTHLVGDFNNWDRSSHPFRPDYSGQQSLTLDLDVGRAYQFRYLRNGEEWMNDSQADAYVYNRNGTYNFVVITDPNFKRYEGN